MAIAFRSIGTRLKVDMSFTTGAQSVSLPAGHVSGDLLLMFVLTDDNTNTLSTPAGWTRLFYIYNGISTAVPFTPRVRVKCFYRIDDGTLGSSVSVSFNTTNGWPTGKPFVTAYCMAYSGCDPAGPIERWNYLTTTSTTAAEAHPQVTTSAANDWLVSFRASCTDSPGVTFTNSVGTDVERQDDIGPGNELCCATYDSNAALTAGLQTQRTTTASGPVTYGGLAVSIVLKPPGTTAVFANADVAEATATASNASVSSVSGPWDVCGVNGLPTYQFAVDWGADGTVASGQALTGNPSFRFGTTGWSGLSASIATTAQFLTSSNITAMKVSPTGATSSSLASAMTNSGTIAVGRTYNPYAWVYSPTGWSDMRVVVDWYDAGGSLLSTMSSSATAVLAGQWTLLTNTGAAPASASRAILRVHQGASPTTADIWYAYYPVLIDPSASGTAFIPSPGDDVTGDILSGGVNVSYGRDQERQLNPAAVGSAAFSVNNVSRRYSPEYVSGPLFGDLDPARDMRGSVTFSGHTYDLFHGKIDDYNLQADFDNRTVDFSFLDGLSLLQNTKLSTGVYPALRTGDVIDTILDLVGWTGPRDIDLGATTIKYWWAEGTDALSAVNDIVKSEGPPSIAYVAPDGTFVFRDRHHRILRDQSITPQADFSAGSLGDCTSGPVTGTGFTKPFTYAHGWRDIVNSVEFEVSERTADTGITEVWSTDDTFVLSSGQSMDIDISGSDPFINAVTPVSGTDYHVSGAGVVTALLNRTSGQSVRITLIALGGSAVVSGVTLRGQLIPVSRTVKVIQKDASSITEHGEKTYPNDAPWANANDADAIAQLILLQYAERRPTVQLRITSSSPSAYANVLQRTISDRVHIRYDEIGLDDYFFIEKVTHTIQRMNKPGQPPVHSVVFSCEKQLDLPLNPFTFDKRGAGFNDGTFSPNLADDPDTVFLFDDPVQGQFDTGLFGT